MPPTTSEPAQVAATATPKMRASHINFYYGAFKALHDVSLEFATNKVTALIGPSGCGKSTFLRNLNRINETLRDTRIEGEITLDGRNILDQDVTEIRRRVGMVFQRPNPFPKSIFENIIYGPKINGMLGKKSAAQVVEESLRRAALWDEVKDKLNDSAYAISGGQQQRLCIARALAVDPEVLLLDEPCSALDPIATAKIEDLLVGLKKQCTIVIVTHNMQQAARTSDCTAFYTAELDPTGQRFGQLVEYDVTAKIFSNPSDIRTENYITGRFG
jgi:phosphate transport system ATP-binding protein